MDSLSRTDVKVAPSHDQESENNEHLIASASELARRGLVLREEVSFFELPKVHVKTGRVSWYASHYLTMISDARFHEKHGDFGNWTPSWWREREKEALVGLANLMRALADAPHLLNSVKNNSNNTGELSDCPVCGRNEWTYSANGDLLCLCGNSMVDGKLWE